MTPERISELASAEPEGGSIVSDLCPVFRFHLVGLSMNASGL